MRGRLRARACAALCAWLLPATMGFAGAPGPLVHSGYLGSTSVYESLEAVEIREGVQTWRWIAPDEGLPEHPSVRWRRKAYPKLAPALLVNTIGAVADAIEQGLGIGALPILLAERRLALRALSEPLSECESELWLLTHPESRHLRRIAVVAEHFARTIALP